MRVADRWSFCRISSQQCCPLVAAFAVGGRLKSNAKKDKAMEQGLKMLLSAKVIDLGLHYIETGEIPRNGNSERLLPCV